MKFKLVDEKEKIEKSEQVDPTSKKSRIPQLRLEPRPRSDNKRKLKSELRKLVESLAQGHKKYQEYGFEKIGEAKARIHELIDEL